MSGMQFKITGSKKMQPGDEDQRYRLTISLINFHRPKYWSFHCPYCGNKIAELSGRIVYIQDIDDVNNYIDKSPPIIVRCTGRNRNEWCRMWFEFVNLSK